MGKKKYGAAAKKAMQQTAVPTKKYYPIPQGVHKKPDCFKNSCLLIAISVSDLFHKAFKGKKDGDKKILGHLKALHYKSKNMYKKQEEAADFILEHTHGLVKGMKDLEPMIGPFTLKQMEPLCKKHKIQVCLYSKHFGNKLVALVPEKFRLDYKKVHLFENSALVEDHLSHVDVLLEVPKTVDDYFYTACCLTLVQRRIQHKSCQHLPICWDCKRPMLRAHDFFSHMMKEFCTKRRKDIVDHKLHIPQVCGCQKKFTNSECFKVHQQKCTVSTNCQDCQVLITAKNVKQLETKRKNHVCYR